jgi:hypothetical protein
VRPSAQAARAARSSARSGSAIATALTPCENGFISSVVKTDEHVTRSKLRRRKGRERKGRPRVTFIGTRPLKFPIYLRGQEVEVKVLPVVTTTTHVNFEITITHQGKTLDWVLTRVERAQIGRVAGQFTESETSH